jgi:hypothetical protein
MSFLQYRLIVEFIYITSKSINFHISVHKLFKIYPLEMRQELSDTTYTFNILNCNLFTSANMLCLSLSEQMYSGTHAMNVSNLMLLLF